MLLIAYVSLVTARKLVNMRRICEPVMIMMMITVNILMSMVKSFVTIRKNLLSLFTFK